MSAKSTPVTPADVAAEAAKEGLVIPGQNTEVKVPADVIETETKVTVVEGDKKTLGNRVDELTEKLKKHQKLVIAAGAASLAATFAMVRYVKKQAESMTDEDQEALAQAKDDAESIADMG